jgi:flagellar basal-body rod modification protein FlgD
MSTSAIQPTTPNTATAASSQSAANTTGSSQSSLASQTTFLQLLVAQLKNQDPQNPADGTQFVTQLAQFTTLEQETQSRSDLDQILKVMQAPAPAAPANSTATSSTAPAAAQS